MHAASLDQATPEGSWRGARRLSKRRPRHRMRAASLDPATPKGSRKGDRRWVKRPEGLAWDARY